MANFSYSSEATQNQARNEPIRSEQDLTHQVDGPLGNMTVVPDNYVGSMPAGAIRESEYKRMTGVYGNIESGQSSLQFDTSSFFRDEQGKDLSLLADPVAYVKAIRSAAEFKQQYMGYLQDLVKTPAGLRLLEQLDTSKHATTIQRGNGGNAVAPEDWAQAHLQPDGTRGMGSTSTLYADPTATEWDGEMCGQGRQPWMEDRPRWGFYHELVHAYQNSRGVAEHARHGHAQCTDYSHELSVEEFQTAGLGPYAARSINENALRAQMGAPMRETYSGMRWNGADSWGQQTDAEEPPRRSPHR